MTPTSDNLSIDLSDIAVDEVILLVEEGSRGIPEFAASCAEVYCHLPCSCSVFVSAGTVE
ncbi:MAG: hypothetical protein AAGD01_07555 [Acidobacteriota bacterium]